MSSLILQCFICNFCNLKFKNSNDLELHFQLHTPTGEFFCSLCKETFLDLTELQFHDLQHSLEEIKQEERSLSPPINITYIHPASSFACKICNKVFLSDEELFDHVTQHTDAKNTKCQSLCTSEDEFKTKNVNPLVTRTVHKKSRNKLTVKHLISDVDGPYECKTCEIVFNGPSSLKRHQRRFHLNKKKYMCSVCFKTFINWSLLCEHSLQHYKTKREEFKCFICDKHFLSSMLLREHFLISHDSQNKHLCKACFKFFSNTDDLSSHMDDHIAAYNCKKCKKWYITKSKLISHRCVFVGDRPYPCKICGKRFNRLYHLQRHCYMHDRKQGRSKMLGVDSEIFDKQNLVNNSISVNNTENTLIHFNKKYSCYMCNTRWYSFKNYKQHFLSEHKELEFNSCPICFKKFNKTCKVKYHLLTHSNKKLFKCNFCSKSYSVQSALKRHSKKHSDQELLSCYQCAKTFVNKLAFQKHILMHEKGKKAAFKCTLCDKKFFKEKLLNEHILAYHDFFKAIYVTYAKKKFSTSNDLSSHICSSRTKNI